MYLLVASSTFKENMPFFLAFPKYRTSFKLWCYAVCVKIAACRLDIDSLVRHTSHSQLLMLVHQLWMLLTVKALCVGELVAYISFFEHKVQKQAPASLNFLHQLPKGLLSFPSL